MIISNKNKTIKFYLSLLPTSQQATTAQSQPIFSFGQLLKQNVNAVYTEQAPLQPQQQKLLVAKTSSTTTTTLTTSSATDHA
jgi:hypothetical protein